MRGNFDDPNMARDMVRDPRFERAFGPENRRSGAPPMPPADPFDALPTTARQKLERLRFDRDILRKNRHSVESQNNDSVVVIRRTEQFLRRATARKTELFVGGEGLGLAQDDPRVIAARKKIEIERLRQAHAKKQFGGDLENSERAHTLVERIETFVRDAPGVLKIKAVRPVSISKLPSKSVIEDYQRHIRELQSDLAAVEHAPYSVAEAKKYARGQIEEMAARGCPRVDNLIELRGAPIQWPAGYSTPGEVDVKSLMFWLNKDLFVAAIEKLIDENSDSTAALTDAARAAKLEELKNDLLNLEREEEQAIAALEEKGIAVARRPDADPRAVLGIDVSDIKR